jgi:hypothetical protein
MPVIVPPTEQRSQAAQTHEYANIWTSLGQPSGFGERFEDIRSESFFIHQPPKGPEVG